MTTQNTNGKKQFPPSFVEDHPQWREYLHSRHVLKSAIITGAWVEYSDYYGRYCLVWHEKRRDGSCGARRRRFIDPPVINGKQYGKSIWFSGEKTNEPFHYVGTLDELTRAIAGASGELNIVEGEIDVWSMHALGLPNTIGLYGISHIPKDINSILDELGVAKAVYFADNDSSGEQGASTLRTLLHESAWRGTGEYRKFAGPGIPEKGDANDLLCHHYPDLAAARAALAALPRLETSIKRKPAPKPVAEMADNGEGWDEIKETVRLALGVEDFNRKGFSKNFRCILPHHEDKGPSAAWHKSGFYKCFGCGEVLNAKDTAELLGIDWRPLILPQPQCVSTTDIDLNAAPGTDVETAPLSFEAAPDSWLRLFIKFCKPTEAVLFHFVLLVCSAGRLAQGFTIRELIKALSALQCTISERSIYRVFEEVFEHDNHLLFAKLDPNNGMTSRNCKFRLRSLEDIRRRLLQAIRYRVYEETFHKRRDTLIGFKVFQEALQGSKLAIRLKSALKPLYAEQKQRFETLTYFCEQKTAAYQAELEDLHATPLPDWPIGKPNELPALLARGIYNADPEDRSKAEWARLLGISKPNVNAVLERAGIKRTPYTITEKVSSQREIKDRAYELGAKIVRVEIDGSPQPYDAAIDITAGSMVTYQPAAKHEIISDAKPIVKAPPAKPRPTSTANLSSKRANNMRKPGNWYKPQWDPQFVYWELVKACCLLHGYALRDGLGIYDPHTSEVWTNPTLPEVVKLIIEKSDTAEPDPG